MLNELVELALSALATGSGTEQSKRTVGRFSTAAIYAVGTAAAAIVVLGCLLAALWLYVQPYVGPGGGALIVAAATAVVWLTLLLLTRRNEAMRDTAPPPSGETLLTLIAEAQRLFEKNKGAVLLTAAIAGIVTGDIARRNRVER